MSWITVIWSINAGICLALAGLNLFVCGKSRGSWPNLLFAIACLAGAALAVCELMLMRAQSPEQFGELWRLWHVPLAIMVVSLIWFVRFYLRAGPLWLAWLFTGLRVVIVVLNFSLHPNLTFREITGLRPISAWGETVVVAVGEKNPWADITSLSGLLFLIFVLVAAVQAWRRGEHRQACVVGSSFAAGAVGAVGLSVLLHRGILPIPMTISFPFLIMVVGIAYELSYDLIRARNLARDLQVSEQRLSLAANGAKLGVWEWDIPRDEIWATEEALRPRGLDDAERINLDRFLQSLHPDDLEPTRKALFEALERGDDFELDYRLIDPRGETRWLSAQGRIERGEDGEPRRMRGVSIDVTERKQDELELQRQGAALTHLQRASAMGQLVSTLAHELSQPLGAILRNAEAGELFLQEDPPDLEELRAILAAICRDDQRAGAVINRLRLLLKRQPLKFEPLPLVELLDQVASLTQSEVQARRVRLEVEVPDDLPHVAGDRIQLQQVLLNLYVNALDAMEDTPPGRRLLEVRAHRADGHVEVAVRDHGHGIPAEEMEQVLQPFFTTKATGLGMGLAISQSIIADHGGRLRGDNNTNGGATFRFTLKLANGRNDDDQRES